MLIDGFKIQQNASPFIIAEIGVNHNGCVETAHHMIDAAADAGANAVKFQTFNVDLLVTEAAVQAEYQVRNTGKVESQKAMLAKLELNKAELPSLMRHAAARGLTFLSSPFDEESVMLLNDLGVPAIKIPSGEITNWDYLKCIGRLGLPVILSTGMSNLGEIEIALEKLKFGGAQQICLLHCISQYPTPPEQMNLRAINTLHVAFNLPVGLSDHSAGIIIPAAATALGACIIEKHFTLDKRMSGPDHKASLDPVEFVSMTKAINEVHLAKGDGIKRLNLIEEDTKRVARKSIVASVNIAKGASIAPEMITAKRPGDGLAPSLIGYILNRKATRDIPKDTKILLKDLE